MEVTMNKDGGKEKLEAEAHVWKYTLNYLTSMTLRCAVQLGIPDIISNHNKPLTHQELVNALSIPHVKSNHMYRVMRILVHTGFFALEKLDENQEEGYVLTPSSKLLKENHNTNLSPLLLWLTDPIFVYSLHSMSSWIQGTEPSLFEYFHGMDVWNYLSKHSHASECFNAGMASDAGSVGSMLIKDYKIIFEGFSSLVDVGGGTGNVAKAISEEFPNMRCTVFDLPQVISNMKGSGNLEFIAGNMFESIPSADIVLLKWIMHDWSDEECIKILKQCKKAILEQQDGKVVIIDMVLDGKKGEHEAIETQLSLDILMMVAVAGKERTEIEWKQLFLNAGFRTYKISHGLGVRSLIEVFP